MSNSSESTAQQSSGATNTEQPSSAWRFLPLVGLLLALGFGLALLVVREPVLLKLSDRTEAFSVYRQLAIADSRSVLLAGLLLFGLPSLLLFWKNPLEQRRGGGKTLLAVFLLALLLLAEAGLRLSPLNSRQRQLEQSLPYLPASFARHRLADTTLTVLGNNRQPIFQLHNGFRGERTPWAAPEGELRIAILGGSFVFDILAPKGQSWPEQLANRLQETLQQPVSLLNCGVPGHTSAENLTRLQLELQSFGPDWVVCVNTWNDLKYFQHLHDTTTLFRHIKPLNEPTHQPIPWWRRLLEQSQLYLRIKHLFPQRAQGTEGYLPTNPEKNAPQAPKLQAKALRAYALNYHNLVDAARNLGARVVLLTEPRLAQAAPTADQQEKIDYKILNLTPKQHGWLVTAYSQVDSIIQQVAAEKQAPYIPVAQLFGHNPADFYDHVHTTQQGSERLAQLLAPPLAELMQLADSTRKPPTTP